MQSERRSVQKNVLFSHPTVSCPPPNVPLFHIFLLSSLLLSSVFCSDSCLPSSKFCCILYSDFCILSSLFLLPASCSALSCLLASRLPSLIASLLFALCFFASQLSNLRASRLLLCAISFFPSAFFCLLFTAYFLLSPCSLLYDLSSLLNLLLSRTPRSSSGHTRPGLSPSL
jgi:hypothetical protein